MKPKIYRTKPIKKKYLEELNSRQEKVEGFDLTTYQQSSVLCIGAGGIGSPVTQGTIRKGLRKLGLLDGDTVAASDLSRQTLFTPRDIGKPKAVQGAKRLSRDGFFHTEIIGYPYWFLEALELGYDYKNSDAIFCCIDNNKGRIDTCMYGLANHIPVIFAAVARDASSCYVGVQEPGKACFGCIMPYAVNDDEYPCQLPAIVDINLTVAGVVVYALDTILCDRYREWNLKFLSLDGSIPDCSKTVERKKDCVLCGSSNKTLNLMSSCESSL